MTQRADLEPGCQRNEAPMLDEDRVRRALEPHPETDRRIEVSRNGDGAWLVRSRSRDLVYHVTTKPVLSCDCEDALYRRNVCLHICASLLLAGDDEARRIALRVVEDEDEMAGG